MPKAQLVTRQETSGTNTENLNKASALTHAEMDKNLIGLRDASWTIADDTSTTLNVTNDKTITIAGGSNITTALSGDTLTITGADQAGSVTALNNQAENRLVTMGSTTTELDGEANLTFNGSTLAVTGAITSTTSIANDAVSIDDNKITSSRSNDDLQIQANGTGTIEMGDGIERYSTNSRYKKGGTNMVVEETGIDASAQTGSGDRRHYHNTIAIAGLDGSDSSDSDARYRGQYTSMVVDLNGSELTNTSDYTGATGLFVSTEIKNTAGSSNTGTMANANGIMSEGYPYGNASQLNITDYTGVKSGYYSESNSGQTIAATNVNGFCFYGATAGGSGTDTITNEVAFKAEFQDGTNKYLIKNDTDTAKSQIGTIEKYRESINSLTSSSTITVDCGLAPVHTVTLGVNTEFVISNLGTGQSVTIIITNGASYTASFGTDASTAVKFPGGAPTLTASGIDAVTIFNDGTNYLGNIAQAYA